MRKPKTKIIVQHGKPLVVDAKFKASEQRLRGESKKEEPKKK